MLGMLFSFQRSWFSFTCGGLVPTVITLAVTVAIVSEREPCLALGTNTKGCLSPLQFGRRSFSVGWCVAVPLLAADLSGAYWHIPGESKQVQAVQTGHFPYRKPTTIPALDPCVFPAVPSALHRLCTCCKKRKYSFIQTKHKMTQLANKDPLAQNLANV